MIIESQGRGSVLGMFGGCENIGDIIGLDIIAYFTME